MDTIQEALDFYQQNYRGVCAYAVTDADARKTFLGSAGSAGSRTCRFCGQQSPNATFAMDAHAIPEALGNKKLFSLHECDACNRFFGSGIENDFGNWSKPARSLTRRRGKRGVPTLKGSDGAKWRMEWTGGKFFVTAGADDQDLPFTASDDLRTLTFELKREPHVPMAVLKTFVKMALTILPENELPNFREALDWIKNPVHKEDVPLLAPVLMVFTPGHQPTDTITVGVICRREHAPQTLPYAFLILVYGNEMYQVAVPSPERDPSPDAGEPLVLKAFPASATSDGSDQLYAIDLSDTEVVRDAKIISTLQFENAMRSEPEAPFSDLPREP
ncbi:HNH endonuclease [Paraburkholderia caribensis]|uniref:HNH endonuclease n=1 Tax=Paraburkholderia caribensis TaxID=75105 RepID=UPI0009EE387F|nr:HNH endonuclease [Paraburkholderia caribensis]